jgi:RHS repeat-associated protein
VKSVDALQGISSQSFDADGNRDSLIDPNKNQTQFTFDLSGRLTQETLATGDKVKYTYSARDLLESVTNGRNQQRQFEYDAAGRLTSWTDPDGTVSYSYDGNGNVLTVTDTNGTITREYDPLNRITKYTDQQGNTLQYEYDPVGNLATLTYPDGKQVHYEYNSANQLTTVMDWAERETRYTYDPNGRLISTERPNGTQMTRLYNEAGQLTQQKDVVVATSEIISQFDFKYDAAGNIIEEKTNFEPDPEINLEMTYQAANRLATIDDQIVQFDADGNLTKGPLNGELTNFTFDSRNRLTQAGSTVYRYDAENQRTGVNQTNYVVNSQPALSQVLIKTKADGTQTFYVYGLGLIGQETGGKYTSYHFDLRGSTVALADETAQVIERFQYSPYGLLLSGDATKTPFLFNGMYGVMTDSNGLYYMRARFYRPEIKRFVNQDILLGGITEGQTLNRYAYVTGRPVSFIDPFGLEKESSVLDPGMTFNPSFWNQTYIRVVTNCYAYALNRPGYHENPGDRYYVAPFLVPTCNSLISGAKEDGLIAPQNEVKGTCGGACPEGYHKIQIFLDFGFLDPDFHVFRQDSNGFWSHKIGKVNYITNLDAEGKKIICPITQSRDNTPYGGRNYPDYCGTLCARDSRN